MKLYLVDGTFELFRCFHGAPQATHAGREVGATRGFVATILALLRYQEPSHLAIAFDCVVSPRAAGKSGDPLQSQAPLVAAATRALGIVLWPMIRRFEADDALATGAAKFGDRVGQVVLCTSDKDLAQCVRGDRVVVRNRIQKRTLNEEGVIKKFGVPPRLIPSYLALVGDPQDGIPGIPGFGKKAAAALLNHYESIEGIPREGADWEVALRGRERLARTLAERRMEALLYRAQIELAQDVPLPHALEDLAWRGAPRAALEAFVTEELGAPELLEGVPRWAEEGTPAAGPLGQGLL